MTLPVFLAPAPQLAAAHAGARVRLEGAEGRHAVAVRRLERGEGVDLVDGEGTRVRGVVTRTTRDVLEVEVLRWELEPPVTPRLVLVQALAKGERGELAVELATEAGVDEVVPWSAARSVAQWKGERGERALQRWHSTAREAAKQARRARWPLVAPLASGTDVLARVRAAALAVVLEAGAARALAAVPLPPDGDVLLVVGPEGGLTEDEVAALTTAGALACRLGDTVLRTSTAGVAALAVLSAQARWR